MNTPGDLGGLVGLQLSVIRRAADMVMLHFGPMRPHASGRGTVGDYALHVQCPWRLDGPTETITGRDDLWEYGGPGEGPEDWTYDKGRSLQDERLTAYFGSPDHKGGWLIEKPRLLVVTVEASPRGDLNISLSEDHELIVFPAGTGEESWRFFATAGDHHVVFPKEEAET